MSELTFGEISGYPQGSTFDSRRALYEAGIHRQTMAGISGTEGEGADSIALSGGYEDDADLGNEIIYTGQGGRDPNSGRQVADQKFTRGNAALAGNKMLGLPVRVIGGAELQSSYAPEHGYRYDGQYYVDSCWEATGQSGFKVWRYRLIKEDALHQPPLKTGQEPQEPPERRQTTTSRVVRDTEKSRRVEEIYNCACQICNTRLETPAGPYAEGAHIKPLGIPHNGPDIESNILCLCPNHHVLFDVGAIALTDGLRVIGPGEPHITVKHELSSECVGYHRTHFGVLAGRQGLATSAE